MSTKDKSGPAFPTSAHNTQDWVSGGMTLRDYFAAKAMQGLLGRDLNLKTDPDPNVLSEFSYEIADAMLEARNQ